MDQTPASPSMTTRRSYSTIKSVISLLLESATRISLTAASQIQQTLQNLLEAAFEAVSQKEENAALIKDVLHSILDTVVTPELSFSSLISISEITSETSIQTPNAIVNKIVNDILREICEESKETLVSRKTVPNYIQDDLFLTYLFQLADDTNAESIAAYIILKILVHPRLMVRYKSDRESDICARDILEDIISVLQEIDEKVEADMEISGQKVEELEDEKETEAVNYLCREFAGYAVFADIFVDGIIMEAVEKIQIKGLSQKSEDEEDVQQTFTSWPQIKSFSVQSGLAALLSFLETWNLSPQWLYNAEFLLAQSDACSDFFLYEVKFGIPKKYYPICMATASVFFKMEVSRVIPVECSINVTYQYEGMSLINIPFSETLYEKKLFDIVNGKMMLFRSIKF